MGSKGSNSYQNWLNIKVYVFVTSTPRIHADTEIDYESDKAVQIGIETDTGFRTDHVEVL